MEERHENEQYFFDDPTLARLEAFLEPFAAPACVCAPMLGRRLAERGRAAAILDVDERFAATPGFERFDLNRPRWLGREFDVIVCDPPFFNVSLKQLAASLRVIAGNDVRRPLLVSHLVRRRDAVLRAFAEFDLRPTGFRPTYRTVAATPKNDIEFFGNASDDALAPLTAE